MESAYDNNSLSSDKYILDCPNISNIYELLTLYHTLHYYIILYYNVLLMLHIIHA